MRKSKQVYIVTSNDYLLYQPTILNVYDQLKPYFPVEIISFEPHFISKQKDESRKTFYIKIPFLLRFFFQNLDYSLQLTYKFLNKFGLKLVHKNSFYQKMQLYFLELHVKKLRGDIIIAVDVAALFVCQKYFPDTEFLSLEIYQDDPLLKKIDLNKINSVFIQNKPRFDFLFDAAPIRTFYVQNAPTFKNSYITNYIREGLVWAGSIVKRFAVLDCIEFITKYPEYRLTLKGGGERKTLKFIQEEYKDLIKNDILKIDQKYLSNDEFVDYLSHYKIGFCFYSWDLINSSINYQTAPSGKLFMCLAAGVPVIASDIPGFQFLGQFNAGVLVKNYTPETIKEAIVTIENNYELYRAGCYEAARFYSFNESVRPYIDYLIAKT